MNLDELKKTLSEQSVDISDPEKFERIITSWKTILETEKNQADIEKSKAEIENINYQKRSDKSRLWIGVVAPLVTAIALMFTLIFQVYQTKRNSILQRQADEDTQWRSFLQKLNTRNAPTDQSIAILLKSFFSYPKYKNQACEIASTVYLPYIVDTKYFKLMYKDFIKVIDWNNYYNIVNLTNGIYRQISDARRMREQDSAALNSKNTYAYSQSLKDIDQINHSLEESHNELEIVGNSLANFFKSNSQRSSISLDLTDGYFFHTDFSNANFDNANFKDVSFDFSNVEKADFANINSFDSSDWYGTAWWRAENISDNLLNYLVVKFPYDSIHTYFNETPNDGTLYSKWLAKSQKTTFK